MPKPDSFDSFDSTITQRGNTDNPWVLNETGRAYLPDYELLEALLAIPLQAKNESASGRFANAIDAWVAAELRRAGFPPDEVWPRLQRPRVLPRELGLFVGGLPRRLREQVEPRLLAQPAIAPRDAKVLGRAYSKQVDVVIAQWSRGPELMVSTKSMVSSFGNNLKNRFEESYGDAKNLRARFPLAAIGFLFVFRSTILEKPGRFLAAQDMLRKLRAESDVYDTTCMVLADWDDAFTHVRLRNDLTPADLQADQFLATLVESVLDRTPIEVHRSVRELHEHREFPDEEDLDLETADDVEPGEASST